MGNEQTFALSIAPNVSGGLEPRCSDLEISIWVARRLAPFQLRGLLPTGEGILAMPNENVGDTHLRFSRAAGSFTTTLRVLSFSRHLRDVTIAVNIYGATLYLRNQVPIIGVVMQEALGR